MTRQRGDSEVIISAWSPDWLDGSGVARVAEWLCTTSQGWQTSGAMDLKKEFLSQPLDVVRTCGFAAPRVDPSLQSPGAVPVVVEMSRLRKSRGGPLEERIVECAASTIPCAVGLHAVDVRRPVPEATWSEKGPPQAKSIWGETMIEFRAMCMNLPVAWAMCSTFGRGISVAELYLKRGSSARVGAVYARADVPSSELDALRPARAMKLGEGVEIALTKRFGGPAEDVSASQRDAIWKIFRKASVGEVPWDILNALGRPE